MEGKKHYISKQEGTRWGINGSSCLKNVTLRSSNRGGRLKLSAPFFVNKSIKIKILKMKADEKTFGNFSIAVKGGKIIRDGKFKMMGKEGE